MKLILYLEEYFDNYIELGSALWFHKILSCSVGLLPSGLED